MSDLSENKKIASDEKLRKNWTKGKKKYMKYFNSNVVSQYIIEKTLNIKSKIFISGINKKCGINFTLEKVVLKRFKKR